MDRRHFLRSTLSAGIGGLSLLATWKPLLSQSTRVAASERITMGFIGLGGNGTWNLRDFVTREAVRVVALCDVDTNHLNRAGDIVEDAYGSRDYTFYTDYRELLSRQDIDAVFISTPDHWHAIIAIDAAEAGKDIFCQKPLGYNIAEGKAMVEAVHKAGIVWQTGSQQRSSGTFRRACELVRNGYIGNVDKVIVGLPAENYHSPDIQLEPQPVPDNLNYNMWLGPAPHIPYNPARVHGNFRWVRDYSGGQITDWAGHHVDIAHWGMGVTHSSPVEIEGTGEFPDHPVYDTVENYSIRCTYREGFELHLTHANGYPRSMDGIPLVPGYRVGLGVFFQGDEGWVHVNRGGMTTSPASLQTVPFRQNDIRLYTSDDHNGNFIDCVYSRNECVAPIEEANRSIMVGHLGLISIYLGRKIRWNPDTQHFENDSEAERYLSRPMRTPWALS